MLLPVTFFSELLTALNTYLLINKSQNFRSSSNPNTIRVNSSSGRQLATPPIEERTRPSSCALISLPTHQFSKLSQTILRFPP